MPEIGRSVEGRPISVRFAGKRGPKVLVVAGQHGDEHRARAVVESLAVPGVRLAVVAALNPDGVAADSRWNGEGFDLNRDHQLLLCPETQALHAFARDWNPDRLLDVHTFPRRRQRLQTRGLRFAQQVFFDGPSHPEVADSSEIPVLVEAMRRARYRAARYVVFSSSGIFRHSTPDPRSLCNAMALRLGVPTLLIEGREGRVFDEPRRAQRALAEAVRSACQLPLRAADRRDMVWIGGKYEYAEKGMKIAMRGEGGVKKIRLSPYRARIRPTRRVPHYSYAVPAPLWPVLERHGFPWTEVSRAEVEILTIESFDRSSREWRAPRRVRFSKRRKRRSMAGFRVYEPHPLLTVMLEPRSKWGLIRWADSGLAQLGDYPVMRVIGVKRER